MTPINTDGRHYQMQLKHLKAKLFSCYGFHFANMFGLGVIVLSLVFLALNEFLLLRAYNFVNFTVMVAAFTISFDSKLKKVIEIAGEITRLEARLKRENVIRKILE